MIEAVYAGRLVQVVDYDVALLTILYAAGGNPVLLGIVRDLWRRCRPYKIHAAVEVTHQSLISSTERPHSLIAAEAAQPAGH